MCNRFNVFFGVYVLNSLNSHFECDEVYSDVLKSTKDEHSLEKGYNCSRKKQTTGTVRVQFGWLLRTTVADLFTTQDDIEKFSCESNGVSDNFIYGTVGSYFGDGGVLDLRGLLFGKELQSFIASSSLCSSQTLASRLPTYCRASDLTRVVPSEYKKKVIFFLFGDQPKLAIRKLTSCKF